MLRTKKPGRDKLLERGTSGQPGEASVIKSLLKAPKPPQDTQIATSIVGFQQQALAIRLVLSGLGTGDGMSDFGGEI